MVKIQIPFNEPKEDKDEDSDKNVDLMSDTEESDLDDEIEDPDWEEVKGEDEDEDLMPLTKVIDAKKDRPKRGLSDPEIKTIQIGPIDDDDNPIKKRKLDLEEIARRRVNKVLIEKQINKHKFSLIAYLVRGIRLVRIANCEMIRALSLSLLDEWLLLQQERDKNLPIAKKNPVKSAKSSNTKSRSKTTKDNGIKKTLKPKTLSEPIKETRSTRQTRSSKAFKEDEIQSKLYDSKRTIDSGKTKNLKASPLNDSKTKITTRSTRLKQQTIVEVDDSSNSDIIEIYHKHSPIKEAFIKQHYQNDREFIEVFMTWFNKTVSITSDEEIKEAHMNNIFMVNLIDCYARKQVTSLIELVVIFLSCLRVARPNLHTRMLNILRPLTMRADIIVKPNSKPQSALKSSCAEKLDFWVEIFLPEEKRWVCVDLCNSKLDEITVLNELNKPFYYLVSFDMQRQCVKPAETTYCPDWYTPAFKRERCDPKWWSKVLHFLAPQKKEEYDHADEEKNQELLASQDLPSSDSAYKNHPLYVLPKHLLKFQGIYPPEVVPVGFYKDQPVYPRDCVQTLMSREKWLRCARSIKERESAYKIVKARPKRDRVSRELVYDLPLELFGEWQTKDYDPPAAKNGKVPRNDYGNVDMYKECMLPKGCSWLKLNGLQRVANKLGIDCAAAVVGFDCNSGNYGSHPIIDGFIVCNEHVDTLQMAWEEEQENIRNKEIEKRAKRVFDNWKKVIKALVIRQKLRFKYRD